MPNSNKLPGEGKELVKRLTRQQGIGEAMKGLQRVTIGMIFKEGETDLIGQRFALRDEVGIRKVFHTKTCRIDMSKKMEAEEQSSQEIIPGRGQTHPQPDQIRSMVQGGAEIMGQAGLNDPRDGGPGCQRKYISWAEKWSR